MFTNRRAAVLGNIAPKAYFGMGDIAPDGYPTYDGEPDKAILLGTEASRWQVTNIGGSNSH